MRSLWKGPFCDFKLFSEVNSFFLKGGIIKTQARNSVILPTWVGLVFFVYNGQSYRPVYIKQGMVGLKLGEFVFTRKKTVHNF